MTESLTTGAEHWRRTRRLLNEHRLELAAMAAGLYPDLPRVPAPTCCAGRAGGRPSRWTWLTCGSAGTSAPPGPAADGIGEAAAHVLPRSPAGQPYPTYAAAIEALDRPALFENRICYRLLDAELGGAEPGAADAASPPRLRFGPSRYFDAVNLGHAVAHELAAARASPGTPPDWADLDWADLDWADCRCAPPWAIPARCRAAAP